MADITTYTDQLVRDFLDAFHLELEGMLVGEFGDRWVEDGINKHLERKSIERVKKERQSPMSVVDMRQSDDEIYDVEHIKNIVDGNWRGIFGEVFGNKAKARTITCLDEIGEMRVNLRHRRNSHVVLRGDLIRFVQNCRRILTALKSPAADKFAKIEESLVSSGSPWGTPLGGSLPPRDEIYSEFVGRPNELKEMSSWFASDRQQILVWGMGGSGKSALAYKFACEVRDGSGQDLEAVCWVSAKKSEFIEGLARPRSADFNDLTSLIGAIWSTLYGAIPESLEPEKLIAELKGNPILLVVDDFDTVSEDDDLADFLLHDLRQTPTRIIYTSRRRELPGRIARLEAPSFSDDELTQFVGLKADEHGVDESACIRRLNAIRSVTDAYPLYVDDFIRHARIRGIERAVRDWQQRSGDAAREYALRRQVDYLSRSSDRILMVLSISNRPLSIPEISGVAGLTDDDASNGLKDLSDWRLVNQVVHEDSSEPAYRMNANTSRLVQQTYKDDNRMNGFKAAFRALTRERVPGAKQSAIANTIETANKIERRQGIESAVRFLQQNMLGELTANSPDLYGVLGRIYSKQPEYYSQEARDAFKKAHELSVSKSDTYYYWFEMESSIAESLVSARRIGEAQEDQIAQQWEECERIAEMGIRRCGISRELCYQSGYAASRQGRSRGYNSHITAQSDYARAKERFYQALEAPLSDIGERVSDGAIYRGLAIALPKLQFENQENQEDELAKILLSWKNLSGTSHYYFQNEIEQLNRNHQALMARLRQRFPELSISRSPHTD